MSTEPENSYWYNLTTGAVEHGFVSPRSERVGPFDTADEAAQALQTLRANAERWAEDDAEAAAEDDR